MKNLGFAAITMANSIANLLNKFNELHQMLRTEQVKAESLMIENFSMK